MSPQHSLAIFCFLLLLSSETSTFFLRKIPSKPLIFFEAPFDKLNKTIKVLNHPLNSTVSKYTDIDLPKEKTDFKAPFEVADSLKTFIVFNGTDYYPLVNITERNDTSLVDNFFDSTDQDNNLSENKNDIIGKVETFPPVLTINTNKILDGLSNNIKSVEEKIPEKSEFDMDKDFKVTLSDQDMKEINNKGLPLSDETEFEKDFGKIDSGNYTKDNMTFNTESWTNEYGKLSE